MINILNGAIYDEIMNLVEKSDKQIKLCAPFIKSSIVNDIYTYKKDNAEITIITNIRLMSFYRKVLDTSALSKIINSGGIVYNYPLLHAKIYLFDNKKLVITSANLTDSGLKRNKEYGILTDDYDLVKIANNDFNQMCSDEITGRVENKHLIDIQNIIDSCPKEIKIELPKYELENDEIYSYEIIQGATKLSEWKRNIYNIIIKFPDDHFVINDFEDYIQMLKALHPQNNYIRAKIRQVLQQLRDLGLIKFEGNGKYMRLFR
ncbi:MAG: phospholipase D-like domain-containing protein [Sedimentibacter saalensis]|uniref:phospholipase D-like domain-containing protein n=1 Tax=Sedimentibacter saalensis TaxID=130788 RepID=UPI002B21FB68|nr:phospholipase D-like domain-containing protein [Sedimentibacter saalensis]MEA5095677.1 phospholipase D-like domain-containing protein [Sedimentibacter saalensis]